MTLIASFLSFVRSHGSTVLFSAAVTFVPLAVLAFVAASASGPDGFVFEQPAQQAIRDARSAARDALAVAFHVAGGTWGMTLVGAVLTLALYRRRPVFAWLLLSGMLGTALVGATLRLVFGRPRPAVDSLVNEPGGSFPSGHVMVLTALVVVLWASSGRARTRAIALVLGSAVVLIMMWARVYAGVHHVTDVVAGAVFALIWTATLTRAVTRT